MPEYGGYFAPLTEYLPDSSQPISGFHRYTNLLYHQIFDSVIAEIYYVSFRTQGLFVIPDAT